MPEIKRKAGRPAQGITKKVSLTLTAEQWAEIEESGHPTVAAYIQSMQAETKRLQLENERLKNEPVRSENEELQKYNAFLLDRINQEEGKKEIFGPGDMEHVWKVVLDDIKRNGEELPDQTILEESYQTLRKNIFGNFNSPQVETKTQYICPFTHKKFSSMHNLVRSAVPWVIEFEKSVIARKREKERREADKLR